MYRLRILVVTVGHMFEFCLPLDAYVTIIALFIEVLCPQGHVSTQPPSNWLRCPGPMWKPLGSPIFANFVQCCGCLVLGDIIIARVHPTKLHCTFRQATPVHRVLSVLFQVSWDKDSSSRLHRSWVLLKGDCWSAEFEENQINKKRRFWIGTNVVFIYISVCIFIVFFIIIFSWPVYVLPMSV